VRIGGLLLQYLLDMYFQEKSVYLEYKLSLWHNIADLCDKLAEADWSEVLNEGAYQSIIMKTNTGMLDWVQDLFDAENPKIFVSDCME